MTQCLTLKIDVSSSIDLQQQFLAKNSLCLYHIKYDHIEIIKNTEKILKIKEHISLLIR